MIVYSLFWETKQERSDAIKTLRNDFFVEYETRITESGIAAGLLEYIFDASLKERLTAIICEQERRIDGRSFDWARSIQAQLDCCHVLMVLLFYSWWYTKFGNFNTW